MENPINKPFCKILEVDGRQFLVLIEKTPSEQEDKVSYIFYSHGLMVTITGDIRFNEFITQEHYLENYSESQARQFMKGLENPDVVYEHTTGELIDNDGRYGITAQ